MLLSTGLRDYMEVLTGICRASNNPLPLTQFFSESFRYINKLAQIEIGNILSFRWIRDYTLFSINIPTISNSLLKEAPPGSLFEFFDNIKLSQNFLLTGLFNSIFLILPLSVIQLISFRRLIIHGVPAATYSLAGYITGQLFFIGSVIFGVQGIIIPWLTIEPLNYISGLILLSRIIFSLRYESLLPINTWNHPKYKNFFINSFLVAWCDQGTIFPILSNITFSANPTIFQGSIANSWVLNIFQNIMYLFGLAMGSAIFAGFLFWLLLKIKHLITINILFSRDILINRVNNYCYILSIALCLASIPYYTNNYLLFGPLGFVSEDRALDSTIFTHNFVKDLGGDEMSQISYGQFMELKLFPFNKGQYLVYPTEIPQSFSLEDLSYRAEFAWVRRFEKLSLDVVSSHVKGRRLSKSLGVFSKEQESAFILKILPKQTPIMTYRLDLNNKLEADTKDILRKNMDYEYILKRAKKLGKTEKPIYKPMEYPYDPILERYYQLHDFDQIIIGDEENLSNYVERNFIQSPFMFVSTFLQNQRDIGYTHQMIGMRTKQQYYQSLIFKLLLKLDIGLFLNRQPFKWRLSGEQEYDLFLKRRMLYKYFDSLRAYKNKRFVFFNAFKSFFGGAINISNQVYNHQFLGTLRNITRFFVLTLDDKQSFKKSNILNYLETRYNSDKRFKNKKPIFKPLDEETLSKAVKVFTLVSYKHNINLNEFNAKEQKQFINIRDFSLETNEKDLDFFLDANTDETLVVDDFFDDLEMVEYKTNLLNKSKSSKNLEITHQPVSKDDLEKLNRLKLILKFDQPLYKFSKFDVGPEPHEELSRFLNKPSFKKQTRSKLKNKRNLKEISFENLYSLPLYAGWSTELGQFFITNKPVTKKFAGIHMYISPIFSKQCTHDSSNNYLCNKKNYSSPSINNFLKVESLKQDKTSKAIKFTCWPLAKKALKVPPYKQDIPYTTLREQVEQVEFTAEDEVTNKIFEMTGSSGIASTRPWIMEFLLSPALRDPVYLLNLFVPKKGGFVWPGNPDIFVPGIKRRVRRPLPDTLFKRSQNTDTENTDDNESDSDSFIRF